MGRLRYSVSAIELRSSAMRADPTRDGMSGKKDRALWFEGGKKKRRARALPGKERPAKRRKAMEMKKVRATPRSVEKVNAGRLNSPRSPVTMMARSRCRR